MSAKQKFEIYYVIEKNVWAARYLKHPTFRASGATPPEALRNLVQELARAQVAGKKVRL